jgi:hypothetical protein
MKIYKVKLLRRRRGKFNKRGQEEGRMSKAYALILAENADDAYLMVKKDMSRLSKQKMMFTRFRPTKDEIKIAQHNAMGGLPFKSTDAPLLTYNFLEEMPWLKKKPK